MIEIDGGEFATGLLPMFDTDVPTYSRVVAVLAGRNPGNILVDDREKPAWCVVREKGWGHTFVGGLPDRADLSSAVDRLRVDRDVDLVSWDREPPEASYPPSPDAEHHVIELSKRPADEEALQARLQEMPPGLEIQRMDAELIERCEWGNEAARGSGTVEAFLKSGLGLCLMDGQEILCEVYAIYWGVDTVEIGVITNENHRGCGYATLTCSHLVRVCEERGHATTWTVYVNNPASAAVARKLGYTRERPFRLLRYGQM